MDWSLSLLLERGSLAPYCSAAVETAAAAAARSRDVARNASHWPHVRMPVAVRRLAASRPAQQPGLTTAASLGHRQLERSPQLCLLVILISPPYSPPPPLPPDCSISSSAFRVTIIIWKQLKSTMDRIARMAALSTSGVPMCSRHEPAVPPGQRIRAGLQGRRRRQGTRGLRRANGGAGPTVELRQAGPELHQVRRQQSVRERDVLRVISAVGRLHGRVVHAVLRERDAVLVNPVG
jgi:hypothetical protein